jgi:phosphoribosylglycinamide formyltransferase-1
MKSIVVLISGRGSNLQSIIEAKLPVNIAAVISNNPDAGGLAFAQEHRIPIRVADHRGHANRDEYDAALQKVIDEFQPDLIVLAGFMRILTDNFVKHYNGRLINIHPSLLPSFPGLNTHRRALEAGVRIHGCTVHFVTPTVDHGPIIVQAAVPVYPDDNEASLADRVLSQEHVIFPQAVRWFVEDRLRITGQGRVNLAAQIRSDEVLISPRNGERIEKAQ